MLADDGLTAEIRRRRWNPSERFWQDADEPLAADDDPAPPDYARKAATRACRHPLFVYIEGHEPEFMRDLGS